MDPKVIKAGIARFLLRKVSRALPTSISDNPFSKIIHLPQMMGLDSGGIIGQFMTGPPMYYWHQKNKGTWVPQSREQAACVYVDGCIVLFGGLNGVMLNDINVLNLQKQKWYKVTFQRNEQQPEPRYGHSAVVYKSNIYIYGGYRRYVESFKVRETYGDVYEFNTDILKWDKLNCSGSLSFRRDHIAEVVGYHMLVHGGINHKSKMLDDIYVLNLKTKAWSEISLSTMLPNKVSHHKSCQVVHPYVLEKGSLDLFSCNISLKKLQGSKIKQMGIYVFGGLNELGYTTNELWILRIGIRILSWVKPETKGKPPCSRYGHSMHFVEFIN